MAHLNGTNSLDQAAQDRRKGQRKRAFSAGLIVSRDGVTKLDCRVEDVTESGAKVMAPTKTVPDELYLLIAGKELAYEAVVAWKGKHECGVRFTKIYGIDTMSEHGLQFLKRLKLERLRG